MRKTCLALGASALVVAIGSGRALAQPQTADEPPPADSDETAEPVTCPTPPKTATAQPAPAPATTEPGYGYGYGTEPTHAEAVPLALGGAGMAIAVGGGVDDFVGEAMRNATNVGGSWTARLTFGTHSYVAGEASYIGSAQTISRVGLATSSTLYGNGAQAALRLNGTISYPIQPFIYGGAAWRHYSLSTTGSNFSDVANSSDAFEIPVGVGVAAYADGVMFDVRGEYRFAWVDHAIVPLENGSTPLVDRWGVTGNLGYAF